jgi:ketosteroid isomerase-like protein
MLNGIHKGHLYQLKRKLTMRASPELHKIIAAWFASWGQAFNGSSTWADRHISHRTELHTIGTDPSEWFEGEKAFEHMKQEMKEMGDIKFSPGEIKAYEEGPVGWGIARPTLALPNGKQVSIRWSAVFHQEDGDWKLVQLHTSVGIINEQLLA